MKQNFFYTNVSDSQYWDTQCKIIFSYEGCWENNDSLRVCSHGYEVIAQNTNPFFEKTEESEYLLSLYKRLLLGLSEKLNYIHAEKHQIEYWELLVSQWLIKYISILWMEYSRLLEAQNRYGVLTAYLLEKKDRDVAMSVRDYIFWTYNNQKLRWKLMSLIVEELGDEIKYKTIKYNTKKTKKVKKDKFIKRLKRRIISEVKLMQKKVIQKITSSDSGGEIVITYFPMHMYNQLKLFIMSLGKIRFLKSNGFGDIHLVKYADLNMDLRNSLVESINPINKFEQICVNVLKYDIPYSVVEGYKEIRKQVDKQINGVPKVVLSADLAVADTICKMSVASWREKGTKLVLSSHAGACEIIEKAMEYEAQLSDIYLTWGIPLRKINPALKNKSYDFGMAFRLLSNYKIHPVMKRDRNIEVEKILYVSTTSESDNSWDMYLINEDTGLKTYFNNQCIFFDNIEPKLHPYICHRLRQNNSQKEQSIVKLIKMRYNYMEIDLGERTMEELFKFSRICIVDCHTTVFAEAVLRGIPTIIILNSNMIKLAETIQPFYDALKKVGICYDSSKKAAEFINSNYNNIIEWWENAERQRVIKMFIDNFIFLPPRPLLYLKNELLEMSSNLCKPIL